MPAMAPVMSQVHVDGNIWKMSRKAVEKRLGIAKELDRDAKGGLKVGYANKRRMDDYVVGTSKEAQAMLASQRNSRSKRKRDDM